MLKRMSLRCSPSISMTARLTASWPFPSLPSLNVTQTRFALGSTSLLQRLTHGEYSNCGGGGCWGGAGVPDCAEAPDETASRVHTAIAATDLCAARGIAHRTAEA